MTMTCARSIRRAPSEVLHDGQRVRGAQDAWMRSAGRRVARAGGLIRAVRVAGQARSLPAEGMRLR
jgi:hypothetical protein